MLSRGQNGEKSKIRRKEFSTFKIVEIVENSLGKSAPMPETGDFGKNGQSVIHISHIAFCGKPPIRHFWAFFTKLPYFSKYRTAACPPRGRYFFVKCIRNYRILQISLCIPLPFPAPVVFLRFPFSAPAVFLRVFLFPFAFFSVFLFHSRFSPLSFPAPLYLPSFSDGRNTDPCRDRRKATAAPGTSDASGASDTLGIWALRALRTLRTRKLGTDPENRDPRRVRGDRHSASTECKRIRQNQNVKTAGEFPIFPAVFRGI